MPDGGALRLVPVRLIGCAARAALIPGSRGTVRAVFARSFYVVMEDDAWLCVGPSSLGAGPLNLCCDLPPTWDGRALGLREGTPVRVDERSLAPAPGFSFRTEAASVWSPPAVGWWTRASLRRALRALHSVADELAPAEGIGKLCGSLGSFHSQPLAAAARESTERLVAALTLGFAQPHRPWLPPTDAVRALIGLGPGLTPSGDDYLAGMLVGLGALQQDGMRRALGETVFEAAAGRTNDISRAHLRVAAQGWGHAALHDVLAALLAGEIKELRARLALLGAIGHTSGWDALAGAVGALRAWAGRGYVTTRT